jgi:quercetin dioxygenase-like cupin family protein
MIPRRVFLGAAALLPLATDNAFAQAPTVTPVHVQDLPDVRLDGWTATVVEVRYPPAGASQAHRHPGFVLGYLLEGEISFGLPVRRRSASLSGLIVQTGVDTI